MYKLSPSDFKYLWEECPHCFYRKVNYNIRQPSIGIPSIFIKMSGMLQKNILGTNVQELVSELPPGKFIVEEGYLKSNPLPSGKSYINGRFDVLTEFNDGTYGIIDLKITDAKDEDLDKFDRQLHAYKYALENPVKGESVTISEMGLLVVSPTEITSGNGKIHYKAEPEWKPIPMDMDSFFDYISRVEKLLDGPEPKPTDDCDWCNFKNHDD